MKSNIRRLFSTIGCTTVALLAVHANAWCVKNSTGESDKLSVSVTYADAKAKPTEKVLAAQESLCVPAATSESDKPALPLFITTSQTGNAKKRVCSNWNEGATGKKGFTILGAQNAQIDIYQRDIPEIKVTKGDVFIDIGTGSGKDAGQTRWVCK